MTPVLALAMLALAQGPGACPVIGENGFAPCLKFVQDPQVHVSDPPAVFRVETSAFPPLPGVKCYSMPSPKGTEAIFCDTRSPATGDRYMVVFINPGGVHVEKEK